VQTNVIQEMEKESVKKKWSEWGEAEYSAFYLEDLL